MFSFQEKVATFWFKKKEQVAIYNIFSYKKEKLSVWLSVNREDLSQWLDPEMPCWNFLAIACTTVA